MDGLVEPSMPQLPSVVNAMKDMTLSTAGRKSSDDGVLMGINTGEKTRFSFASPGRQTRDKIGVVSPADQKDETPKKSPQEYSIRLTRRQQKDIADAFNAFDVHGTGYMSTIDLRVALKALGFESRREDMKKILEKWDKNYGGRLCYADFMSVIEQRLAENDTKDDILKAFNLFDKDSVGRIAFHNLRDVADELQEDCNDEEIAEMLVEADLNDDGVLDEEEFMKVIKQPSPY